METILFLMDKFAVGDAFIHELSMVVDSMPKSYLIKQRRNKLKKKIKKKNMYIHLKRTIYNGRAVKYKSVKNYNSQL